MIKLKDTDTLSVSKVRNKVPPIEHILKDWKWLRDHIIDKLIELLPTFNIGQVDIDFILLLVPFFVRHLLEEVSSQSLHKLRLHSWKAL